MDHLSGNGQSIDSPPLLAVFQMYFCLCDVVVLHRSAGFTALRTGLMLRRYLTVWNPFPSLTWYRSLELPLPLQSAGSLSLIFSSLAVCWPRTALIPPELTDRFIC